MDINKIRKINPTIVHGNRIDSFEKQLIKLNYGELDMNYPMLISTDSRCLKFISKIDVNRPLLINPKKVLRIKTNHNLDIPFIMDCYDLLENSLFSVDSLTKETSKVIVSGRYEEDTGNPIIIVCRHDAKRFEIDVNQITSYYGKEKFVSLLRNSWEQGKCFDKNNCLSDLDYNKKIEQLIKYTRLQLPNYLTYALSSTYYRQSFTKNQVEQDLSKEKPKAKQMLNNLKNKSQDTFQKAHKKRRDKEMER